MSFSNRESTAYSIIAIFLLTLVYGILLGMSLGKKGLLATLGYLVVLIFIAFVGKKIADRLDKRIDGLMGEFKVGVILGELWSKGIRHVDDVVLKEGRGNIDHIAVAKTGVWAIETKSTGGKIDFVDGKLIRNNKPFTKDYLKQARAEAFAVRELLAKKGYEKMLVRPVLVFAGKASMSFWLDPIDGVYIIGSSFLSKLLLNPKFESVLSPADIDRIVKLFEE